MASVWDFSADDTRLYERMFSAADTGRRGRVSFLQSQLQRSGLPALTLDQIWSLADTDGDKELTRPEYYAACHLVMRNLKLKTPVPAALPADLAAAAARAAGAPLPTATTAWDVSFSSPTPSAQLAPFGQFSADKAAETARIVAERAAAQQAEEAARAEAARAAEQAAAEAARHAEEMAVAERAAAAERVAAGRADAKHAVSEKAGEERAVAERSQMQMPQPNLFSSGFDPSSNWGAGAAPSFASNMAKPLDDSFSGSTGTHVFGSATDCLPSKASASASDGANSKANADAFSALAPTGTLSREVLLSLLAGVWQGAAPAPSMMPVSSLQAWAAGPDLDRSTFASIANAAVQLLQTGTIGQGVHYMEPSNRVATGQHTARGNGGMRDVAMPADSAHSGQMHNTTDALSSFAASATAALSSASCCAPMTGGATTSKTAGGMDSTCGGDMGIAARSNVAAGMLLDGMDSSIGSNGVGGGGLHSSPACEMGAGPDEGRESLSSRGNGSGMSAGMDAFRGLSGCMHGGMGAGMSSGIQTGPVGSGNEGIGTTWNEVAGVSVGYSTGSNAAFGHGIGSGMNEAIGCGVGNATGGGVNGVGGSCYRAGNLGQMAGAQVQTKADAFSDLGPKFGGAVPSSGHVQANAFSDLCPNFVEAAPAGAQVQASIDAFSDFRPHLGAAPPAAALCGQSIIHPSNFSMPQISAAPFVSTGISDGGIGLSNSTPFSGHPSAGLNPNAGFDGGPSALGAAFDDASNTSCCYGHSQPVVDAPSSGHHACACNGGATTFDHAATRPSLEANGVFSHAHGASDTHMFPSASESAFALRHAQVADFGSANPCDVGGSSYGTNNSVGMDAWDSGMSAGNFCYHRPGCSSGCENSPAGHQAFQSEYSDSTQQFGGGALGATASPTPAPMAGGLQYAPGATADFGISFAAAPAPSAPHVFGASFGADPQSTFDSGFGLSVPSPAPAPTAGGFGALDQSDFMAAFSGGAGDSSSGNIAASAAFSSTFDDDFTSKPLPPPPPAPAPALPPSQRQSPSQPRLASSGAISPMTVAEFSQYHSLFESIAGGAPVTRFQANDVFSRAQLPSDEVDYIWVINDVDMDGKLNGDEFAIALHIAAARYRGAPLPEEKPNGLLPLEVAAQARASSSSLASSCGSGGMGESSRSSSSAHSRWRMGGSSSKHGAARANSPRGDAGGMDYDRSRGFGGGGGSGQSRSGMLRHQNKSRWCVLSGGYFSVFKAQNDKTPLIQLSLRVDVQRLWQSNMNTFSLILDPNRPGAKPKKTSAVGPPEKLEFTADVPSDLTGWVKALQFAIAMSKS